MASYRAEIQIGVVGIGQLGTLQKSLNQVSKTVDLLNTKKIEQGFNVQNINTYNAQLQKAWQNINKAAIGSQEEFKAVQDLVAAKRNQVAVQERLNRLIKEQEIAQRKIIATRDAGFGLQGPKLPPGFTSAGKKPAGGGLGFNPAATPESLALGAGFPLLFGGGVGQVAGGLLGSFFGSGFGGQILGSAIGQQLEDALKRITDIGRAAQTLNLDKLRDSVIAVNADLDITVERLIKAGQADAARAAIAKQVTLQTGLLPEETAATEQAVSALNTAWNEVVGAVSGLLSIIGRPFVTALAVIAQGIAKAAQGVNILLQLLLKYNPVLALINKLWTEIGNRLPKVNEEQEQLTAEIERQTDAYSKQLGRSMKLEEIDKRRNRGNTAAARIQNNELDRQAKIQELRGKTEDKIAEARLKFKGQDIKLLEAQIRAEAAIEERAINREAARQRERLEIQLALEALTKTAELEQSRLALSQALNTEELSRLTRQKELALSLNEEFGIINNIATVKQQVAADELKAAYDTAALAVQKAEAEGVNVAHTREIAANQVKAAEAKYRDAQATAELEARQERVASYSAEVARQSERAARAAREQIAAVDNSLKLYSGIRQAAITINNAAAEQLRTQLDQVQTEGQRKEIIERIRAIEIKNAYLTYQVTIAQIQAEIKRQQVAVKLAESKFKEYEAVVKMAEAQGVVTKAHYDALEAQASSLNIARDTLHVTEQLAQAQMQAADAIYKTTVAQAQQNAQQKLASGGRAGSGNTMGSRAIEDAAADIRTLGRTSTQTVSYSVEEARKLGIIGNRKIASSRARTQAQNYNANMAEYYKRAAANPNLTIFEDGSVGIPFPDQITDPSLTVFEDGSIGRRYGSGMDDAMARYSGGQQGSSVGQVTIKPEINVTTGPVMNVDGSNYVNQNDFMAGMQTASRRGAEIALQMLQTDRSTRRAVGIG